MKIAILNSYQNKVSRGAETFVRELSFWFSEKNKVEILSSNGIPSRNWPIIWRAFLDPKGLQILFFTLKQLPYLWKKRFDIVIPINGGWQPAFVRILTWLRGGKVVISGQSGIGWDDKNNLWSFPDTFVALSSYARKWTSKVNPLVKVEYIPNGVDLKKFSPKGEKLKVDLKSPVVLVVGALTPSKRIDFVIKAVSKLRGVSLLVVGDGELKDKLKSLGEKLLDTRFQLIKLPFEDMPKVYRTADLFTLVSESYYSFEVVLVEAMATNLPVVANNDPIRREIVGDAGILVDPTDIKAYAKALEKAMKTDWDDKPRKQAEKFSWDKIARNYEQLFSNLLAGKT